MPLTPVSEDDVEFARTTFNQFLESEVGFVPPNLFERAFQLKKVDGGSLPTLNPCVDTIPSWTEAHKDIDMEEPTTHYADFLDLDLGLRKADFLHTNNAIEHNPYQKFLERSAKVLNSGGVLELTITWKKPDMPKCFERIKMKERSIGRRLSYFPIVVGMDCFFYRKVL